MLDHPRVVEVVVSCLPAEQREEGQKPPKPEVVSQEPPNQEPALTGVVLPPARLGSGVDSPSPTAVRRSDTTHRFERPTATNYRVDRSQSKH
jgi:hypothetical protein